MSTVHLMCVCVCVFLLLSLARCDVERGSRWSQGLGEHVHPHHQTPLTDSTNDQSKDRNGHGQKQPKRSKKGEKKVTDGGGNRTGHTDMMSVCYLLYVRLQWAVQRPALHMFRYKFQFPQDVEGQSLLN